MQLNDNNSKLILERAESVELPHAVVAAFVGRILQRDPKICTNSNHHIDAAVQDKKKKRLTDT